jgi:hypothetical protein
LSCLDYIFFLEKTHYLVSNLKAFSPEKKRYIKKNTMKIKILTDSTENDTGGFSKICVKIKKRS